MFHVQLQEYVRTSIRTSTQNTHITAMNLHTTHRLTTITHYLKRITGTKIKTVIFLVAGMMLMFREYRRRKAGSCIISWKCATHIFEHLRCKSMRRMSEYVYEIMPYYATIYLQRILIAYIAHWAASRTAVCRMSEYLYDVVGCRANMIVWLSTSTVGDIKGDIKFYYLFPKNSDSLHTRSAVCILTSHIVVCIQTSTAPHYLMWGGYAQ